MVSSGLRARTIFQVSAVAWALLLAAPVFATVRAYIPMPDSNSVAVVAASTGDVITYIPVGTDPRGVAVDPYHGVVYVTNYGSNTVSAIDAASNTVFATFFAGGGPMGIAVAPDDSTVYVGGYLSNTVSYFTALRPNETRASVHVLVLQAHPTGLACSPDGAYLYIASWAENTVTAVSLKTSSPPASINAGKGPFGIAGMVAPGATICEGQVGSTTQTCSTPESEMMTVANSIDNTISFIDPASQKVIQTVDVGANPQNVATFPFPNDGVLVSNLSDGTVTIVDANTSLGIPNVTVNVGSNPSGLSTTLDGSSVWALAEGDSVAEISPATSKVTNTITGLESTPAALGQFFSPVFDTPDLPLLFVPVGDLSIKTLPGQQSPTFQITNNSPTIVADAVFDSGYLPPGINFIGARPSQGGCQTPAYYSIGHKVRCDLGMLAPYGTAVVYLTGAGTYANATASVSSNYVSDTNPDNNSVTYTIGSHPYQPPPPPPPPVTPPILSFSTSDAGPMVSNYGDQTAPSVEVWMELPEGVTVDPAAPEFDCYSGEEYPSQQNGLTQLTPVIKCHLFAAAASFYCGVVRTGLICYTIQDPATGKQILPDILPNLTGHSVAYAVFPVDLSNVNLLGQTVHVGFDQNFVASAVLNGTTMLLAQAAFLANANVLFPNAYAAAQPITNFTCNPELDAGFGALLNCSVPKGVAGDLTKALGFLAADITTVFGAGSASDIIAAAITDMIAVGLASADAI